MEAPSSSPLFALPAELRNHIYRFALVQDTRIDVTRRSKARKLGLLRTCKQIRQESLSIYYSENKFLIRVSVALGAAQSLVWPCGLPKSSRQLLRHIIIEHEFELFDERLPSRLTNAALLRSTEHYHQHYSLHYWAAKRHLRDIVACGLAVEMVEFQAPNELVTWGHFFQSVYKHAAGHAKKAMLLEKGKAA